MFKSKFVSKVLPEESYIVSMDKLENEMIDVNQLLKIVEKINNYELAEVSKSKRDSFRNVQKFSFNDLMSRLKSSG